MSTWPYVLGLPHAAWRAGVPLSILLRRQHGRAPCRARLAAFALTPDETRFVDQLSERHRRFWIFRCNQRRFCGDFAVVDMSAPAPARRRLWIVELKRAAPLRLGGGGAGNQLRNRTRVAEALSGRGVIDVGSPLYAVVGDRRAVLAHLT